MTLSEEAKRKPPLNPHHRPDINVLVGYRDGYVPIYATVSFSTPLQKGMLHKLAEQLADMELRADLEIGDAEHDRTDP